MFGGLSTTTSFGSIPNPVLVWKLKVDSGVVNLDRESRCFHWTELGPIFSWSLPKQTFPTRWFKPWPIYPTTLEVTNSLSKRVTFSPSQKNVLYIPAGFVIPHLWLASNSVFGVAKIPPNGAKTVAIFGYFGWIFFGPWIKKVVAFRLLKDLKDFSTCFNTSLFFEPIDKRLLGEFFFSLNNSTDLISPHTCIIAQKIPFLHPRFFSTWPNKNPTFHPRHSERRRTAWVISMERYSQGRLSEHVDTFLWRNCPNEILMTWRMGVTNWTYTWFIAMVIVEGAPKDRLSLTL